MSDLRTITRADTAIVVNGRLMASTASASVASALAAGGKGPVRHGPA